MCFCPFLSSSVRRARKYSYRAILEGKEWTDARAPASQNCQELRERGSLHGKPGSSGAANPDKSFIPYHVFPYGLGCVKPRSMSELPCSLFSAPKDYFLGLDLVVAAAAEEEN